MKPVKPLTETLSGIDVKSVIAWQQNDDSDPAAAVLIQAFKSASHICLQQQGAVIFLERGTVEALAGIVKGMQP